MAKKKMYLGYQGDKIKFYTETPLDETLYCLDKIEETTKEYIVDGDQYVLKTEEVLDKQYKIKRTQEILNRLEEIDKISIRAIRANDTEYLQTYEEEAIALRAELNTLK